MSLTMYIPCLESHFKGVHLAIARLPGLFGRLLRVEVKKTILRPCLHGVGDPGLVG